MLIQELTLNDDIDFSKIGAISLVEKPAIELNFIALSEDAEEYYTFSAPIIGSDEDQQMVYGPALIPNKLIKRRDKLTGEMFAVYFSKETVKKCMESYMTKSFNNFTMAHDGAINDCNVLENWYVINPEKDKSADLGIRVPEGTWMTGVKINNKMVWEKVKAGQLKGFSIEGYFTEKMSEMMSCVEVNEEEFVLSQIKNIYNSNILEQEKLEKIKILYNGIRK